MMVTGKKLGPCLWFERDFNRICFDLRDNTFKRRLVSGRLKKIADTGVAKFFRGVEIGDIIGGFEDDEYAKLIRLVVCNNDNARLKNFASIFAQAESYLHYESYLLLGISFNNNAFTKPVSQFPKEVRKFMVESRITFSRTWEKVNKQYPDLLNNICTYVRAAYFMDLEVYRMIGKLVNYYSGMEILNRLTSPITELVGEYSQSPGFGCEYKSLIDYVVKIVRTEAQSAEDVLISYRDYLSMTRDIERNKMISKILTANPAADVTNVGYPGYGRIEKYPVHLAVRHAVVTQNYRNFMTEYDEVQFAANADENYAWKWGDYQMVVPKTPKDVQNEGTNLHHCVASYVKRVLDGTTQILFMRENEENEDESLVTVEVRNGQIIQARGYNNREIDEFEAVWLERYAKAKNLDYRDVKRDENAITPTPLPTPAELTAVA